MSSVVNRNGHYYFRLRVPKDLKQYFHRIEFFKSLHTESYHHAKSLARCILGQSERLFLMLRSKTLDIDSIRRLIGEFVSSTLELKYDDAETVIGSVEYQDMMSDIYDDAEKDILVGMKTKSPVFTPLGFTGVSAEYLCWSNGFQFNNDSPAFRQLNHELAISKRDIIGTLKARLETNDSEHDRDVRKKQQEQDEVKAKSNSLSEAITAYRSANGAGRKMIETTDKFIECFEYESGKKDILLSEINYDLTKRVGERLAKYPKYRNTRYKGKSLDEIYALGTVEYPSTTGTVKDMLSMLSGVYSFSIDMLEGISRNFTRDLYKSVCGKGKSKKGKSKASNAKDVFREPDIQEIVRVLGVFKSEGEFEKNPHLLFITLMGLFTGARINEICQLTTDDIEKVDGLWCIRHQEEEESTEKSLKNCNSIRINPIHPALIEFGLIRFRDSQVSKGYTGLWEGGKNHSCAYYANSKNCSHYVSKWWNGTFKNKLTLSNAKRQTYHSSRHTQINWFRQNVRDLDYIARNALSGHLDKEDVAALELQGYDADSEGEKTYCKDLNVKRQMELLEKLDYGIDLTPLKII